LSRRQEGEAQALASLTGWNIDEISKKANISGIAGPDASATWWQKIWR
jgi:hypothetical protein